MAYEYVDQGDRRRLLRRVALFLALALIGGILLFALFAAALLVYQQEADIQQRFADDPVQMTYASLEYALGEYSVREGHSPSDWNAAVEGGVLERARRHFMHGHPFLNPYTGGQIRFVRPGEVHGPGDVLYLPAMELFSFSGQNKAGVSSEPRPTEFHLIVFGPQTPDPWPEDYLVDFDLDGQRDEIACSFGEGIGKLSGGGDAYTEPLEQTLERLGLEKYWIGEK